MASGVASLSGAPLIKARRPKVEVAGTTLDDVQVMSVVWRVGASPNQAEISLESRRFHDLKGLLPFATVEITIPVGTPGKAEKSIPIFVGRVTGFKQIADRSQERIVLVCLGPRFDLGRDYVLGQRMHAFTSASEGTGGEGGSGLTVEDALFTADSALPNWVSTARPCVFNADGFGNRVPGTDPDGGVFWPDGRVLSDEPYDWTVDEMVTYCYAQRFRTERREGRLAAGAEVVPAMISPLGPTAAATLGTPLAGFVVYGLNVDGMRIVDAMHTCIDAAGLHWWVKPTGIVGGPVGELKAVFKVSDDATVGAIAKKTLHLGEIDDSIFPASSVDAPNITPIMNAEQVEITTDYSSILSGVGVFGAPTVAEGFIDLRPGWNARDEEAFVTGETGFSDQDKLRKVRESNKETNELWAVPGIALGDGLSSAYAQDVGRLFLVDELGYETDRAFGSSGIPADPTRGFIYADWEKLGMEGPFVARPRPFLSQLVQIRQLLGAISALSIPGETAPGAAGVDYKIISTRVLIKHDSWVGPKVEGDPGDAGFREVEGLTWSIEKERGGIRFHGTEIPSALFNERNAIIGSGLSPFPVAVRLLVAVESDWLLGGLGELGLPLSDDFASTIYGTETPYLARMAIRGDREYGRQGVARTVTAAAKALRAQGARRQLLNSKPRAGANVTIPWITTSYYPTDYITSIAGRGTGKLGQIVEVNMDFQAQTTSITCEDETLALEVLPPREGGE